MFRRHCLILVVSLWLTSPVWAGSEIDYRYWFDGDSVATHMGHSNAKTWQMAVDVSSLNEAIHTIHLQVVDKDGVASSPVTRYFVKTMLADKARQVAYWVDNAPEPMLTSNVVNGTVLLDVNELSNGFHVLHVQAVGERHSSTRTFGFYKLPGITNIEHLNCICRMDGDIYRQERLSVSGGVVSWKLDVSTLSQGIHLAQLQLMDDNGLTSRMLQAFFYRTPTRAELGEVRCYYSIDGGDNRQLSSQLSDGLYHFDIDVASLDDGPHLLSCMLSDGMGTNSRLLLRYFIKTPVGGYGVSRYEYWLNDSTNLATSVTLPQPSDPFQLITLLPIAHWPLRSSNFEFGLDKGKPVVYARNDLHVRFYNEAGRYIDMTRTFIDPVVKHDVADITLLLPDETKSVNRPEKNQIVWYKVEAERGDSMAFKSDRACTIQVFSPSGTELSAVSGDKSVVWDGLHAPENGTYYIAQHDMTTTQGNTLSISYRHIDKYAILRYTPTIVGASPCFVSVNLDGNGYDQLTDAKLKLGDREIAVDTIIVKNKSEASLWVSIDSDYDLGKYDIILGFEDNGVHQSLVKKEAVQFVKANVGKAQVDVKITNYAQRPMMTISVKNTGNTALQFVPLNIAFDEIHGINTVEFKDFRIDVDSLSYHEGYHPWVRTNNFLGKGKDAVIYYTIIPILNPNEKQEYNLYFTAPINYTFNVYAWTGNAANSDAAWNEGETNIPSLPHYYQMLGTDSSLNGISRAPSVADFFNLCQDVVDTWSSAARAIGYSMIGMQHTIDDAWIETSGGLLTSEDFGRNYRPLPPPSSFVGGSLGDILHMWESHLRCPNNTTPSPRETPVMVHAPCDPNEVRGYVAESGSHAIRAELKQVDYTIEFENDP